MKLIDKYLMTDNLWHNSVPTYEISYPVFYINKDFEIKIIDGNIITLDLFSNYDPDYLDKLFLEIILNIAINNKVKINNITRKTDKSILTGSKNKYNAYSLLSAFKSVEYIKDIPNDITMILEPQEFVGIKAIKGNKIGIMVHNTMGALQIT